jgi:hypothetical protein
MRLGALLLAAAGISANLAWPASAVDPRALVRKCVELDQSNWLRMKDYTWVAKDSTRHLDADGQLKSVDSETWETVILSGRPYRKILERNGIPLTADQKRKEQDKLDRTVADLERETPQQRDARVAAYQKERAKDREFLLELPDAMDFRVEGDAQIDGRDTWVIAASPKPGYHAKHGDANAFSKIEGRIWIDKAEFQWARIEAKTVQTISWGLCLARLNPGGSLVFEQTRVNDEIWLPKREFMSGSGKIVLLRKLIEERETTWTNYRKFHVDSNIVSTR